MRRSCEIAQPKAWRSRLCEIVDAGGRTERRDLRGCRHDSFDHLQRDVSWGALSRRRERGIGLLAPNGASCARFAGKSDTASRAMDIGRRRACPSGCVPIQILPSSVTPFTAPAVWSALAGASFCPPFVRISSDRAALMYRRCRRDIRRDDSRNLMLHRRYDVVKASRVVVVLAHRCRYATARVTSPDFNSDRGRVFAQRQKNTGPYVTALANPRHGRSPGSDPSTAASDLIERLP